MATKSHPYHFFLAVLALFATHLLAQAPGPRPSAPLTSDEPTIFPRCSVACPNGDNCSTVCRPTESANCWKDEKNQSCQPKCKCKGVFYCRPCEEHYVSSMERYYYFYRLYQDDVFQSTSADYFSLPSCKQGRIADRMCFR